jgi:NAD/NADP transhydrogenase alpha subunit
MMPLWFLILFFIATLFGIRTIIQAFSNEGLYIAGERISRATAVFVTVILVAVWAIILAIRLGFITDYAP